MNNFFTTCLFGLGLSATTLSAQYCTAVGPSSTGDSNLESVALTGDAATMIAYTGCSGGGGVIGLEDLTASQSVNVTAGSSYTANTQFGTCGGNYNGAGEAWIDWNQNSIFEATESIGTWSGGIPANLSAFAFTVPINAFNGSTRMRIMQQESGSLPINPCGTFTWGSAADFSIVVSGGVIVTCPSPSALNVTNITATTATFDWVENGAATNWEIDYGPQGFTQGSATGTSVLTTTNPHNQTLLSPSSTLDYYVRSICGAGDTSIWVGPLSFTTLCATAVAPWSESFTGTSTPNCWAESGSEAWRYNTSAGYAAGNALDHTGNGGNYAWIDGSSPNGPNQISTLESPPIDVSTLTAPLLSYWVFSHNSTDNTYNTLTVEVYDGAAWNVVNTINTDQGNGWNNIVFDLQNLTITGPIQVRFTIAENSPGTAFYNDILIDDIEVKEASNVSADALLGLQALYCNAPVSVDLVISNNSNNPEIDVPWAVESNGVILASGVIANLAPNGMDTIPLTLGGVGPAGPNAMITAYTYLAADIIPSDDTITLSTGMSHIGVNATMSNPVGCAGAANGEIQAMGNSGVGMYTYQWDASTGNQTTSMAVGLSAGTYMLTVTDSIGCSAVATLTLLDPPSMNLTSTSTNLNCTGDNSGSAVTTVNGGVPGYSYLWSNGQSSNRLMNAAAGTYVVSVTDANGCQLTDSIVLSEPASAVLASVVDNGNGTATASVSGGLAPYTYLWDASTGSQTTMMATGLTAGNVYYVVVTDANGCSDVISFQAIALDLRAIGHGSTLNMFPNPTSGNVFVDLNLEAQADVQIQITTVTGQTVMTHLFNQAKDSKFELETAQLPTGVYMVKFTIGATELTKKLIVTK